MHALARQTSMKLQDHRASEMRLRILRTAGDLFSGRGLGAITTSQIMESARVDKAEFRQYFKTKSELIAAVLRDYFEAIAAGTGPVKYELQSWDDLQECLQSHIEFQKRFKMTRSCPISTFGNECEESDELTRQALGLLLDLMMTRLESFFSREKVAGRLAPVVDVEQLANFCVATIQGALFTGKIKRNSRVVETVLEDLLRHLKCYVTVPQALNRRFRERGAKRRTTVPPAPQPRTDIISTDRLEKAPLEMPRQN